MSTRKPVNEKERLNKLRSLDILNPELDEPFHRIVRLAAQLSGCSACFLSFIEEEKQIIRSTWGAEIPDGPRQSRLCSETILSTVPYTSIKENSSRSDDSCGDHFGFSFYIGFPILSKENLALGTLSLLDHHDHSLSDLQMESLQGLATHTFDSLELASKLGAVKRALTSLEDSEQRFRKIADASPVLLWISDEAGNRTLSNTAWCAFTGLAQEESLAECWRDTVHPQDRAVYAAKWSDCVKLQSKFQHEYRLLHVSGSYRWVMEQAIPLFSSNGRLEAYVSSCVDLSLRNSDELQNQHNEARFRAISEAAPLGIVVTDSDGTCIYSNSRFQEIAGVSSEECLGTGWLKTVDPLDAPSLHSALHHATQSTTPFEMTFRFKLPTNIVAWCNLKAATINSTDTVSGWVFTVEDITQQRNAEQALLNAKNTAEAAMQAKGQFLANMSHEIRTPLTAIIGFADALLDEGLSARQQHTVDIIRNNGKHLLSIINQILDLTTIDSGALTISPTCSSLRVILDELRLLFSSTTAEKAIELTLSCEKTVPDLLMIDTLRVKQVLINLIGNAIKFTDRGVISVRALWRADDSRLTISISDTGIGIEPEKLGTIFEPFSQANESSTRSYGGTGLGLSISRMLVRAMSGEISAASAPHSGSTFSFDIKAPLPTEQDRVVSVAQQREHRGIIDSSLALAGRVLFADDALDNRRLIEHLLLKAGTDVILVEDGLEAVDILERESFDLILMDVQMPVMDGLTATRKIRAKGITTPIVAISAGAMATDIEEALAAGCEMHLSKPFEQADLIRVLKRYLHSSSNGLTAKQSNTEIDDELEDLIDEFAADLPNKVGPLALALEREDLEHASNLAHRLKGSAGMYRFKEISKLADSINSACKEQNLEQARKLILQLSDLATKERNSRTSVTVDTAVQPTS